MNAMRPIRSPARACYDGEQRHWNPCLVGSKRLIIPLIPYPNSALAPIDDSIVQPVRLSIPR